MIYWTPKNHVKNENHVILETSCGYRPYAAWSPKNIKGRLCAYQTSKDTHHLWAERKALLQLKSDNELACFLLGLVEVPALFNSDKFSQDHRTFQ